MVWQPQKNTNASAGSATRNKAPILAALQELAEQGGADAGVRQWSTVLEVASGFGEHARHFAPAFSHARYFVTEAQLDNVQGLQPCVDEVSNVDGPLKLNVLDEKDWQGVHAKLGAAGGAGSIDLVLCINMIHLCPWAATEALFTQAAKLQSLDGIIFLYGAYQKEGGGFRSEADAKFDADIRSRDPHFGLR